MKRTTTLHIHCDSGGQNQVFIRGERAPFSWDRGLAATRHEGNLWSFTWEMDGEALEFKVLINDREWSVGANLRVFAGTTKEVFPCFRRQRGRLELIHYFDTPIIIYLPPSYDQNRQKPYPVLYCHDGQNLFDPATSFKGEIWGIHETVEGLVAQGMMEEILIVGIFNRGLARLHDYTPSFDPAFRGVGAGGGADDYAAMIIEEIKPYMDRHYRTLADAGNTALMGASLGGLVSLYMARKRPDIFSKVASLSSSFWWNRRHLIRQVVSSRKKVPISIYLDAGTGDSWRETQAMYQALLSCGYEQGRDLHFHLAPRHAHSEQYWGERVHLPLTFMFPPGSTSYDGALVPVPAVSEKK